MLSFFFGLCCFSGVADVSVCFLCVLLCCCFAAAVACPFLLWCCFFAGAVEVWFLLMLLLHCCCLLLLPCCCCAAAAAVLGGLVYCVLYQLRFVGGGIHFEEQRVHVRFLKSSWLSTSAFSKGSSPACFVVLTKHGTALFYLWFCKTDIANNIFIVVYSMLT